MMNNVTTCVFMILLAAVSLWTPPVHAEAFADEVKKNAKELCDVATRILGSADHDKAKETIATRIEALPNITLVRQSFEILMPTSSKHMMSVIDGPMKGDHAIHPLWPESVRLNTTPKEGFSGKVVYVADAQYESLPAKSLRGAIAAVDMSSYHTGHWLRAFDFGAKAVLLLGSKNDSAYHPRLRPFYKPRFYVPEGDLADACRAGKIGEATLFCNGSWSPAAGENLLALVKGTDPSLKPIVLAASYDAMCLVPNLAKGADNAVDAGFLLQFLNHLSVNPPKRGVLVAFVDGFSSNMMGMRHLCSALSVHKFDLTRMAYETYFTEQIKEYEEVANQVTDLGEDYKQALPQLNDTIKFKLLQRYVKDVLSPEILEVREDILKLRLAEYKAEDPTKKAAFKDQLEEREARKKELDSILSGIINKGVLPENKLEECKEVWSTIRNRTFNQLERLKDDAGIFSRFDATRNEILSGMGLLTAHEEALATFEKGETEDSASLLPFPFILGVDISDAGINMGPALYCGVMFMSYDRQGRPFTKWLKNISKASKNPFDILPAERLKSLGMQKEGVANLVEKILNAEAAGLVSLTEEVASAWPGIESDTAERVIDEIQKLKAKGVSNFEDAALAIITREVPDIDMAAATKLAKSILNRESMKGGISPDSINVGNLALMSSISASFEMGGVTWATLEGGRWKVDTPQDRFENLDWGRLRPQIMLSALVIDAALNDPGFEPEPSPARSGTYPRWRLPEGITVSETVAETISRTPRPGMLATSFNERGNMFIAPPPAGFRINEFVKSGPDGRFRFDPAPNYSSWPARNRNLKAYYIEEDGSISRSIAKISSILTKQSGAQFILKSNPPMDPLRGDTFECIEINGPTFRDPRYQIELKGGKVYDVTRGGVPKKYIWNTAGGPMNGLLPPETRFQVVLATGAGKNRMALLNIPDDLNEQDMSLRDALQLGFNASEPLPHIPEYISAKDFFMIDEWRLRRLEGAGVSCKALREIHTETDDWLEKAKAAFEADNGAEYKRASATALANEIRVYQAVQDQANDVTRGAIFLLLLLVPFSIALERLLFASPEIGKQIAKSMIIFAIMFAALASFHPGFKITTMPAVILIAFMILLLSISVIKMLLGKFKSDMEELRRGTLAEASGAQTGRGGVIVSAVWLGIANMRKRMVRTLLTGLTIVLVTFSLLCFTSSSTYQDKRITTLEDVQKTHDGVLLQHPSSKALENESEDSVANMLGKDTVVAGRYWVTNKEPTWRLHVRNEATGELVTLKAGLALSPHERRFSNIDKVLNNWDEFAKGNGCYLPEGTAEKIGVKAGESIVVAGTTLKVIDTFDSRAFETKVKKLDGLDLLPVDYSIQTDSQEDVSNLESEMSATGSAAPPPDMVFVSGDEFIVLPIPLAKRIGGSLRSLVVGSDTEKTVDLAKRLVKVVVYPVYFGAEDGNVKALVSTPLIPKAPRNLLIPIAIAVLIIFNTMLNSIAERKKEIYIYSSLGLAPGHIGVLFLAEALTYGVMGSVFGYVIGQGVATVLTHFNLMGGITLNYSGTNVIMTMGLVLLVVIISAIVPALMAAKVASPSGDLDWKVPQPEDGVIKGSLPFTVSTQAAPGLAAFLHEFIVAHADGAIGNFTSDNARIEPGEGTSVVRLKSTIWPAPYDLGVRQDICIEFEHSESDICDLRITLTHGAGPERSWWRLNKVFLGVIRSQLLGWRNIAPERMLKYIRQSEEISQGKN